MKKMLIQKCHMCFTYISHVLFPMTLLQWLNLRSHSNSKCIFNFLTNIYTAEEINTVFVMAETAPMRFSSFFNGEYVSFIV